MKGTLEMLEQHQQKKRYLVRDQKQLGVRYIIEELSLCIKAFVTPFRFQSPPAVRWKAGKSFQSRPKIWEGNCLFVCLQYGATRHTQLEYKAKFAILIKLCLTKGVVVLFLINCISKKPMHFLFCSPSLTNLCHVFSSISNSVIFLNTFVIHLWQWLVQLRLIRL